MYDYKQEFSDNVDILSQSYRIEFLAEDKDSKFEDADGYIDPHNTFNKSRIFTT